MRRTTQHTPEPVIVAGPASARKPPVTVAVALGVARLAWRTRWQMLPYNLAAGTVASGLVAAAGTEIVGWEWVAGGYAAGALVAGSWISMGLRETYDRILAGAAVVIGGAWSVMVAADPAGGDGHWLYLGAPIVASVLGVGWWFAGPCGQLLDVARIRDRFAVSRLGDAGGRVLSMARTRSGLRIRIHRGGLTWDQVAEVVAEVRDVAPGQVVARPDRGGNLRGEVRVLELDMFAGPELAHPAVDDVAGWAPGSRSILKPVPVAVSQDGEVGTVRLYDREGGRRILSLGASSSGKSNTASVIIASVAACRDAVLIGADVAKAGVTIRPWERVFASTAYTVEAARAQARRVLDIIAERGERVARSDSDVWQATPRDPAIVYMVLEAAALLGSDKELARMVTDVVLTGRQVGVTAYVESQGGDYESIPTTLRSQLSDVLCHRMDGHALRVAWPAAARAKSIDMGLFEIPGMVYMGKLGSTSAIPARTYALYEPPIKRALADRYESGRPRLDGGEPAEALERPAAVDVDTAERVAAALAAAGPAGMTSGDAAMVLDSSRSTAVRALRFLLEQGRAQLAGKGPASRWYAADQGDDVEAAA
jgi:hypothetical protein